MSKSLKTKLRELRNQKRYSLDALAEITGTSKSYLWELENRDTRKPSGEKITKIAQALGVTTDYLLDDSAIADDNVAQKAFFRKFNKLDESDKKKIEDIISMWSKKDGTTE